MLKLKIVSKQPIFYTTNGASKYEATLLKSSEK